MSIREFAGQGRTFARGSNSVPVWAAGIGRPGEIRARKRSMAPPIRLVEDTFHPMSGAQPQVTVTRSPRNLDAPPRHTEIIVPTLPATSLGDTTVAEQAVINALAGTEDVGIPYPPPTANSMPSQETTPNRRRAR